MWASDCARLEEAHRRGDAEVVVYGRKYVVNMKVQLFTLTCLHPHVVRQKFVCRCPTRKPCRNMFCTLWLRCFYRVGSKFACVPKRASAVKGCLVKDLVKCATLLARNHQYSL